MLGPSILVHFLFTSKEVSSARVSYFRLFSENILLYHLFYFLFIHKYGEKINSTGFEENFDPFYLFLKIWSKQPNFNYFNKKCPAIYVVSLSAEIFYVLLCIIWEIVTGQVRLVRCKFNLLYAEVNRTIRWNLALNEMGDLTEQNVHDVACLWQAIALVCIA